MARLTYWFMDTIDLATTDSVREERVNAVTHGVGLVLAVVAAILLVRRALAIGDPTVFWAYLIYGMTMVLTYGASTCYHAARGPFIKRVTRLLDHLSIFLLIAGTYTAVLSRIDAAWSGWVLIAAWGMAVGGILSALFFWQRFKIIHVGFYLAMGWLVVVKLPQLIHLVTPGFLASMIGAGLSYTLGTVMYGLRRIPYHHAIWHLFVLAGSAGFFVGVYWFL